MYYIKEQLLIQLCLTHYNVINAFVRIFIDKSFQEFDIYSLIYIDIDIGSERSIPINSSSEPDAWFI